MDIGADESIQAEYASCRAVRVLGAGDSATGTGFVAGERPLPAAQNAQVIVLYLAQGLREQSAPVRFSFAEVPGQEAPHKPLELVLNGRHRLRIGAGVEGATLPTVLALPASVRIYLCITPCDMRKSFDGFQALAVMVMALDPFDGHLLNQMG